MARVLRGDVYWADLNPARGREQSRLRPVFVISHEALNRYSGTVIALENAQALLGEDRPGSHALSRAPR